MKKLMILVAALIASNAWASDGHDSSPQYVKAKSLGFNGYSWLAALDSDYKEMGGKKLQKVMILVDKDCGSNFKALQRVDQYVLFTPGNLKNTTCSGRERVAVLPAKGVTYKNGDYINEDSYYVFMGVLKGESTDGFPTQVLVLKQVSEK